MLETTMRKSFTALMLLAGLSLSSGAQAVTITVDGNLADWGLQRNGNATDWNPDPALNLTKDIHYKVEDQTGNANVRLNPGWGGQAYDAEALYVYLNSTNLYLALVTGLDPKTATNDAANTYGPGDFAIDFGRDGTFEFGIETTGPNAGAVYKVTEWGYGLWDVNGNHNPANPDKKHPTSVSKGSQIGAGTLLYTDTPFKKMGAHKKDEHYVIEAAIPLSVFLDLSYSGKFDVHWTMDCANDAIWADPELTASAVPEPTTLALLPLGLLGLMAMRRRAST
jgi:hypothetical protein